MRIYTVHIADPDADAPTPVATDPVPIKEGFCWPAFFFNLLWALWHRLWLVALGLVGINALLTGALIVLGADELTNGVVNFGFALLVGMIANDLRRWTIEREGMIECGVAIGTNADDALERFLRDAERLTEFTPPPTAKPPPAGPYHSGAA